MKIYKYLSLLTVVSILLISCDKYLDVEPRGKVVLSKTVDYDMLLNSVELTNFNNFRIEYLTDNVDLPTATQNSTAVEQMIYRWEDQYTTNVTAPTIFWAVHYRNIYYYNAVINDVMASAGGTDAEKKKLKAEALLGRAYEYFFLVNLYGKVYDASTADADPSVPFTTSTDVMEKTPAPSSVDFIYQHIIDDINMAIPDLPQSNALNRLRGSKASAYSVLAKIYYYMGNHVEALKNANLSLSDPSYALNNYNEIESLADLPSLMSRNQEAFLARYAVWDNNTFPISGEFYGKFSAGDLRLKYFYAVNNDPPGRGDVVFPGQSRSAINFVNFGTSVPEMKLIAAEAEALNNNLPAALAQLNELRQNRIVADEYVPIESTDQTAILDSIRDERRRELAFCGTRWFDMRLLDKQNKMSEVKRLNFDGEVIATLPPGSPKYTLQIPTVVRSYNDWP